MAIPKYDPKTGIIDYQAQLPDFLKTTPRYADNNFSNLYGLLGNQQVGTNYQFGSTGLDVLTGAGFDKNLVRNQGFQNFLFNEGYAKYDPTTGFSLVAGLDKNKVDALQAQYTSGNFNAPTNTTGSPSMFDWGVNKEGQTTWGGGTGLQWLGAGLGTATSLYGMYNAHKSMQLAKQNFAEQKALNHANYAMQAQAYNENLKNQYSGRSFSGMSGSAQRTLGREYLKRKAKDNY